MKDLGTAQADRSSNARVGSPALRPVSFPVRLLPHAVCADAPGVRCRGRCFEVCRLYWRHREVGELATGRRPRECPAAVLGDAEQRGEQDVVVLACGPLVSTRG